MTKTKTKKREYMPPSYFSSEKGMRAGTEICRNCNLGKRMATLEACVPILGKEDENDPALQLRVRICEHCGDSKITVTNRRELECKYSYNETVNI